MRKHMSKYISLILLILGIAIMIWYAHKVDNMMNTYQTCTDEQGNYLAINCK